MKQTGLLLFFLLSFINTYSQNIAKDSLRTKETKDSVQTIVLDTLSVTAPSGPPPYQPAAPRVWEIKNTRVALSFNFTEKTADAKEWITMHPYYFAVDTVTFDAKGMKIDSVVLVENGKRINLNYQYKADELKIHFARKYSANEYVGMYFKYTAMPYAAQTGGSGAIRDDRGLYFINTDHRVPNKPAQIWTQGETESNSHWLITIDKPNTRFTTQVELTVPDSFTTLSNGALVKKINAGRGMRTDVWKMDMPIQAYVVMFAVGKFAVDKNVWHNKEVSYYVEPEYLPYAYLMFNHTRDMMEYFSQITGVPYPWNKYSQVVVRDYVSGAMENTTAALFGEFMNQNAREVADKNSEDVVSHELFHEWFGDYVTCESWSNVTVNESFANYGEQLWRRYRYGSVSADELAYNDLHGYLASASYNDAPLVRFNYDNREEVFDAISYNKGGAILHYLNSLIGDAAFNRAMNIYLTRNALHSAEAHQWRLAVEEATGQDWNWFFNQWYYRGGHPELKVSYRYDDTMRNLIVTVTQTQEDSSYNYRLPLKTAVYHGNEKKVVEWDIRKRKEVFSYPYKDGVAPLIVPDCNHVLPGEIRDNKKLPQWREQFVKSDDFVSKRLAVTAAGKVLSDTNSQAIFDMALADNIHAIRRIALSNNQFRNTTNDKYRKRWEEYVMSVARYDSDKLVRVEAFNVLGTWKVAAAKPDMVKALNYSSYAIAGSALYALAEIDKDTAYIIARQMVNSDPKASLESAIWSVIGKKGADDDAVLFEKYGPYVFGNRRFSFTSALYNYVKAVKSDESFRKGADMMAYLVMTEEVKAFKPIFANYLFQLASSYKDDLNAEKKEDVEAAQRRLDILKVELQKVTDAEKDTETQKEETKRMRGIFG